MGRARRNTVYEDEKTFEVPLETPMEMEIKYLSTTDLLTRRICIDAVVTLPMALHGVSAFCFLRQEQRHFAFSGMREINWAGHPDIRTGQDLMGHLLPYLHQLDQLRVDDLMQGVENDPRLVLLGLAGHAAGVRYRAQSIDRITEFMDRAVRWVKPHYASLLAERLVQETRPKKDISHLADRVFENTRDEIFFEMAGIALQGPEPGLEATGLLQTVQKVFAQGAKRPPPWYR